MTRTHIAIYMYLIFVKIKLSIKNVDYKDISINPVTHLPATTQDQACYNISIIIRYISDNSMKYQILCIKYF